MTWKAFSVNAVEDDGGNQPRGASRTAPQWSAKANSLISRSERGGFRSPRRQQTLSDDCIADIRTYPGCALPELILKTRFPDRGDISQTVREGTDARILRLGYFRLGWYSGSPSLEGRGGVRNKVMGIWGLRLFFFLVLDLL